MLVCARRMSVDPFIQELSQFVDLNSLTFLGKIGNQSEKFRNRARQFRNKNSTVQELGLAVEGVSGLTIRELCGSGFGVFEGLGLGVFGVPSFPA